MKKEQEAQQAQTIETEWQNKTITQIKTMLEHRWDYDVGYWINYIEMALEIVDSQAQKIEAKDSRIAALQTLYSEANQEAQRNYILTVEQAQKIKDQAQTIATNAAYAIELQGKIAEQAEEIERLNGALESATEDGYDRFDGRNRTVKGKLVP